MVYGKKFNLWTSLKYKEVEIKEKFGLQILEFFPKTFRLDIFSDLLGFMNSENDGLWIKKPHSKRKSRISIYDDVKSFKSRVQKQKSDVLGPKF